MKDQIFRGEKKQVLQGNQWFLALSFQHYLQIHKMANQIIWMNKYCHDFLQENDHRSMI